MKTWWTRDCRPRRNTRLLGLYHGVPLTDRGAFYMALPDRISIYQKPIEAMAHGDEDRIKEQVRRDGRPRDRPLLRDRRRASGGAGLVD